MKSRLGRPLGLLALGLALGVICSLATPLFAAGELARARAARAVFLQNISTKARSDWLTLIAQFEDAAKAQSQVDPAAKARYLGAELAWLSYERFKQPPDLTKTLELARRVVRNCPRCEPTPGALVLIGRALAASGLPDEAYRELLKVEVNFPKSPERVTARALMTALRPNRTPPPEPEKPPQNPDNPSLLAKGSRAANEGSRAANEGIESTKGDSLGAKGRSSPTKGDSLATKGESDGTKDKSGSAKDPPNALRVPLDPAGPLNAAGQTPKNAPPPLKRPNVKPPTLPKPRTDGRAWVYGLTLIDYGPYQEVVAYVDQAVPHVYNLLPPSSGGRFRAYVDLKGARLHPGLKTTLNKTTDLVKLVKASQMPNEVVRVVADLPAALAYRPLILDNPTRLVIQVAKEEAWLPKPEIETPPAPPPIIKPPRKTPEPTRPVRGPASSLARQLGLKIRRVVIDPGHGGKDAGATGHSVKEKDVALKVGLALAEKIHKRLGLEVILTRSSDKFVTLDRRSRLARENQGDLFLSIHVNANTLAKVEGFETYILNFTDNRSALDTAARENAAADKSMSEMFNILETIAKNTRVAESRVLAKALHVGALTSLSKKYKVRDLGVKEAVFLVLVNMSVPSVLLEIGFVTNADEAARLTKDEYLDLMTDGLVNGLKSYIDGLPK
ncbi:MAG: N-acetylmuramoyl-L-alanine amidase [Deltaproteobacteria bacterium]|nr:N-acetylmuramoyl-L-alanine amidase [Deltaproteobacteria bacterium]